MLKTITLAGAATVLALSTAPSFAKELKSIGVSLGSLGNPFFVALSKGAEFEAKKANPNVKVTTVGFNFRTELEELAPLPSEDFECGLTLTPKVDRTSRITVRQCHYSVPARFIGERVRVLLRGNELLVFDKRNIVARHPRLTRRGGDGTALRGPVRQHFGDVGERAHHRPLTLAGHGVQQIRSYAA